MRRISVIFLMIGIFVLTMLSCSDSAPLTIKDDGATLELKKGEVINVVLESRKKSERVWEIGKMNTSVISLVNGPVFNTKKNLEGDVMEYMYTFRAERPGRTTLRMVLHDPDKPEKTVKNTFELRINVSE